MRTLLKRHWRAYAAEAGGIAAFVFFAGLTATLLESSRSPLHGLIASAFLRHLLLGVVLGLVSMGVIYSPWGKQSGAQVNPAVTCTLYRLGRISAANAVLYILMQFAGAVAAIFLLESTLGAAFALPPVSHSMTKPGPHGTLAAFAAEFFITFVLMSTVLILGGIKRTEKYVGAAVGILIALYVTFESPLSGMSLNPARSFASALAAHQYTHLWIYFIAPPLAALLASELFLRLKAFGQAPLHPAYGEKLCVLLGEIQYGSPYPTQKSE